MIDKLIDPILAPFRAVRDAIFRAKQAPQALKGDIARAKGQVVSVKSDFQGYGKDLQNLQKVQQQQGIAGGVGNYMGVPGVPQQPQQMQQMQQQMGGAPQMGAPMPGGMPGAGAPGQSAPAAQPKVKMGWFSKKKKCPACGQKLHPSWTECPFCGWGKAAAAPIQAPMPAQQKMRTMALDMGAPIVGGPMSDGMVGWFIPLEGTQTGELFQVKGRTIVGKAPDCNIVINDPSVSGRHCEFVPTGGGFRLNDLGSTNGTYVNDKRVTTHDLVDNDNVRLGKLNFKYKSVL